jgi:NitT/TauT family transport system ATP-binding protein
VNGEVLTASPATGPRHGAREASAAASVEIEDLSMAYEHDDRSELLALDRARLGVAPSELCSVVGPSGCGKSTLLMLVAGLYRPTGGRVLINGQAVTKPWDGVGMVFQRDVLLEWRSVLDNVLLPIEVKRWPKKAFRDQALALLALVGLGEFASAYPDQLSGGMRQRVAICRALIHDPPLLLMDEPFGALDALTREKLNVDLLRLTTESAKTVIFVTHSIEEAVLLSDQVVVMSPRPGTVVRTFKIDLPKPRNLSTRSDARYHALVHEIREVFHSMGII